MLTNCLCACAHLTITVSEIERDIGENNGRKAGFFIPLAFDAPIRGFPSEYRHPVWYEKKLEWCRYPTVKKFRRYVYSFWRDPRTWRADRRTDGQTDSAWQQRPRLCIASRGKNRHFYVPRPSFFVCPMDAPVAITQSVAWMKRQFSACQTPRSMYTYLSSRVSELYDP